MPDNENNNSGSNQAPEGNPFSNIVTAPPLTSDRYNNSYDPNRKKNTEKRQRN